MQVTCSGQEFYLDGLVLDVILDGFCARELGRLTGVCKALRLPAQLAAHRALVELVMHLQCCVLRHFERDSYIHQLAEWEALSAANQVWLQADPAKVVLVQQGELSLVRRANDLSGHNNAAVMHHRMPTLREDAVNGHHAFEFDGASVLKTRPFAQPLAQPITLVVVARARGDTTIVDSLGPQCADGPSSPRLLAHACRHMRTGHHAPTCTPLRACALHAPPTTPHHWSTGGR